MNMFIEECNIISDLIRIGTIKYFNCRLVDKKNLSLVKSIIMEIWLRHNNLYEIYKTERNIE